MDQREIGRERGRKAALEARKRNLPEVMLRDFRMNLELFPTLGKDFDFGPAVLDYDGKRLASTPDYTKFPEMRGLADRYLGEREGFIEGSGFTPIHAAYHYSFGFYIWRHVNSKHAARYDLTKPQQQCTNVFFPEGADGVTTSDNRDDVPRPWYVHVPKHRIGPIPKDHKVHWHQGGVSSAVMLDEEPACIFPYSPFEFITDELLGDVREVVKFMDARRDFWGPGNQIWVDKSMRAVAVEKANIRVAYRYPKVRGAVCITACSYLDPALAKFKRERHLLVAKAKGETPENSTDLIFGDGCDARHRRLWALTEKEAGRPGGATLWGAFQCVADTEVPFPDRVCLAGERTDPKREPLANWTLTQHAIVQTGPKRRALYRAMQDLANPRPIYFEKVKMSLGEGVAMDPAWQADIDAGRYELESVTPTA